MLSRWWTLGRSINRLRIPSRLIRVSGRLQFNPALLSTKVSLVSPIALRRVGIRSRTSAVRTIIVLFRRGVHGWHIASLLRVLLVAVLIAIVLLLGVLIRVVRSSTTSPAGERVWVSACAAATAGCDTSRLR